ncbi:MAG: YIP1 family protein [Methanoregulaceae archaeon]|nr:MAG: YIP1 family protein [Methanoregulaceae archaeon]
MSTSLIDILVRPDAFFSSVMAEKESLKIPALIILSGGIVAAITGYLMGGLSAKMMAGVMPGLEVVITLSATAGALIGTFIFWLVASGIFYLISSLLKGQGSFTRVLEVIGYGYLPQIAGSIITLVAAVLYIPKITVPTLTKAALEDPAMIEQVTKAFMHDPAMMELTQITTLVSIVFMLWSAHIWIFGIKHARGLSPRNAAICVGVPIVLYVVYLTYNLGVM